MSLDHSLLTERPGYLEGEAKAVCPESGATVTDYKQLVCKRYISLNPEQIEHRLGGTGYQVTRKYDGELAVLFYDGVSLYTVNTGGRVRLGLAVHDEALARLQAAGVTQAVIPSELYVAEDAGRTRVFDVSAVLADPARHGELRLAVFDIVSLDGDEHRPGSYTETHGWLSKVFTGALVHPVEMVAAASSREVAELCTSWVAEGGAEGLVVRTDLPFVYKVKPVYTLDVAVIGYSENPDKAGQVRSLLVALTTPDGRYQPVGHVGSGFNEVIRSELHARLSPTEVASSYIETDTNHVAFHMVRPELTIELKINDVLFESPSGPVFNPLLEFAGGWSRTGTATGLSILHPVLVRVREDKAAAGADARLEQIEQYWSWPLPAAGALRHREPGHRAAPRGLHQADGRQADGAEVPGLAHQQARRLPRLRAGLQQLQQRTGSAAGHRGPDLRRRGPGALDGRRTGRRQGEIRLDPGGVGPCSTFPPRHPGLDPRSQR